MSARQDSAISIEEQLKGMVSKLGSTERIQRLNMRSHSTPQTICLHRARAYTAVYKETEGESISIRRAKALKKTLEDLPVNIDADELIVGRRACRVRSVPVVPETHASWLQTELETLPTREQDPFQVSPEQMNETKELLEYWKGKTLYDEWFKITPPELADKLEGTGWGIVNAGLTQLGNHYTAPWERIINSGLESFQKEIEAKYSTLDLSNPVNSETEKFLRALQITIDAIKRFSNRYAEHAKTLASKESDVKRKGELLKIAEICSRVPYYGARNFYEAIQSVWMMHTVIYLEGTGLANTIGRFDQYMYPFYKADLENGIFTKGEIQELIENFYINLNDNIFLYDFLSAIVSAGFTQYQVISLAGVDKLGKDATNDLTYLCLDAAMSVRTVQPDLALLCHPRETPYDIKMKAAELVKTGLGLPKFYSTETVKTELMQLGYTREEASMGWIRGCSETYGPGSKQYGHAAAAFINICLSLEAALFNGIKQSKDQKWSGEQIGLATGDATTFGSFDELMDAVKKQIALQLKEGHIGSAYVQQAHKGFPLLVQSILTDDCIGRGLPANAGGALINVGPGLAVEGGWATVADSLAAIKKLVFEEKRITMAELLQALKDNFEGHEVIQQMLINDAPKFGNDDDYVDDIARELFHFVSTESRQYIGIFGNRNMAATNISIAALAFGFFVAATPDGRKAGLPLSDNVGPTNQRDTEGPVAHINSVTKLGLDQQNGTIHNIYFTNVNSDEKKHRMIDLIDAYQRRGGHHLQINCIDKAILLDAQQHPEKYPTLMVRVAGYLAYFTDLSKGVQDDIISRTDVRI